MSGTVFLVSEADLHNLRLANTDLASVSQAGIGRPPHLLLTLRLTKFVSNQGCSMKTTGQLGSYDLARNQVLGLKAMASADLDRPSPSSKVTQDG